MRSPPTPTASPRVLARRAVVLAVDGEVVWLAVTEGEAPEVATAGARGVLAVVVHPA
jgi:hypothetical protein